ncbi:hypothetical protein AKO1_008899 [Acrasis kona]|uniref:2'-5' RNA ligase n=1 Tax=Acrasis kona TaxID=1008807 RepID=A0AAW2ZGV1_9EUKA
MTKKQAKNTDQTKLIKPSMLSAACIVPPKSVWDQIQRIRSEHDKSYNRWMPHINLLYPFVPPNCFEDAVKSLESDLTFKQLRPFNVIMQNIQYKDDAKYLNVFPQEVEQTSTTIIKVQSTLQKCFPHCSHTGGSIFSPHLTLGQFEKEEISFHSRSIQEEWIPIEFLVTEIHFLSRKSTSDPFQITKVIKLPS